MPFVQAVFDAIGALHRNSRKLLVTPKNAMRKPAQGGALGFMLNLQARSSRKLECSPKPERKVQVLLESSKSGGLGFVVAWLSRAARLTAMGNLRSRRQWSAGAERVRRVRIIWVNLLVSSPLILESVLEEARNAALAGGLTRVCRMHIHIGSGAEITQQEFAAELALRLAVPLFEGCDVSYETVDGSAVLLKSIEGVVPEPAN